MADVKWINIDVDMFDDEKIAFIESLPEGDKILNIWIRLICMAGKCNEHGYIFISPGIPCSAEYLCYKFRKSINVINLALETFKKLGMIEMDEAQLFLPNFDKHQYVKGLEKIREQTRNRVAKHRAKIKELQAPAEEEITSNEDVTLRNVTSNATDTPKSNVTCSPSTSSSISINSNNSSNISNNYANEENYLTFFNNNFHLISSYEIQTLQSYVDDGIQEGAILIALKEAVERNRRDMGYVKRILDRWLENNIKTVEAVIADKAEWVRKKTENKGTGSKPEKIDTFNNYQQRDYDFKDLEGKLSSDVSEKDIEESKKLMEQIKNRSINEGEK